MSAKLRIVLAVGLVLLMAFALWKTVTVPDLDPEGRPDAPSVEDETPVVPPVVPDSETPPAPEEAPAVRKDEPTDEEKPAAPPGKGSVKGRVLVLGDDGSTEGVRVQVTFLPPFDPKFEKGAVPFSRSIDLDPDGSFSVDGLPAGRYVLTATHPRLAAATLRFDVAADTGAGPFEIEFRPGGSLRVTVLDPAEQPMEGQEIRISGPVTLSGKTRPDGQVDFERLPVGSYRVRWEKMVRQVAVVVDETTEYTFHAAARFRGVVKGPDGEVPGNYIVRLLPVKYGPEGYRAHQGWRDAKGGFDIRGIQPGEYELGVQVLLPDSYVTSCGKITFAPGDDIERDVQVRATLIAGRITRADTGQPVAVRAVQIAAHRVRLEGGKIAEHFHTESAMAWSDADGRYAFVGIPPGAWLIWISPHGRELAEERRVVEVPEGARVEGTDFELRVKRLGIVRLRILGTDGKPVVSGVSFCSVDKRDGQDWWTTLRSTRIVDGAFEFEFDKGKRRIAVMKDGHRTDPDEITAVVEEGRTVETTCRLVRQGSVLVTILDAAGQPVEKAIVKVARGTEEAKVVGYRPLRNGVFEVRLDPGEVTIHVSRGATKADPVKVVVKAGESVSASFRLAD